MSQSQAALLCCQDRKQEGIENNVFIRAEYNRVPLEKRAVTNIMPLRSISGASQLYDRPARGNKESGVIEGGVRKRRKVEYYFRNKNEHVLFRNPLILIL